MNCHAQHIAISDSKTLDDRLDATLSHMDEFGLRFPESHEFELLHKIFQPMIAAPITSNASVKAVHTLTGQCVFLLPGKSGLLGSMLLIQLSASGLSHLRTGARLGHEIDQDWICKPHDVPAALVVWGLLGKSAFSSGRVLSFSLALARHVYSDVPILTYAATTDGARIMERVGFRPTPVPGLFQLDLGDSDD